MKHQTIIATLCVLLFALLGCEQKAATSSPSVGPFDVNSDSGRATGKVFGVDFEVAGASRAEVDFQLSGAAQSSSRAEITLADDLKIELVTKNDGDAGNFQMNGERFGVVERGDQVTINADRKVAVNGEKRSSEESPPEVKE
jgi:hypothetical protein